MAEIKAIQNNEDLEVFMLKHGENIVDCLGEQVDRIEKELKSQLYTHFSQLLDNFN